MIRRRVILAVVTTGALIFGGAPAFSQQSSSVISVKSAPRATPRTLDEMRGAEADAQLAGDARVDPARLSQASQAEAAPLAQRLADMRARSQQLQRTLGGLQSRLAAQESDDEDAVISPQALAEHRQAIEALRAESAALQQALSQRGQQRWADGLAALTPVLGSLDGQLAMLGLVLAREGDKARVANALELDLAQLQARSEALNRLSRAQYGPALPPEIIRPPAGISPDRDIIRPAEGVNPSGKTVRPARGISPQGEIIRPPAGVAPSNEVIRPPSSVDLR